MTNYEERVISVMLNKNTLIPMVSARLAESDFFQQDLRRCFVIIRDKFTRTGSATFTWFSDNHEKIYDPAKLVKGGWSEEAVEDFCVRIREDRQKRDIDALSDSVKDQVKLKSANVSKVIQSTTAELFRIASSSQKTIKDVNVSSIVSSLRSDRELFKDKTLYGFSTGLETVNNITKGIQKKQFWVIGGYTSYGKSWLSLYFSLNAMKTGAKVAYLSLEMNAKRLMWRIMTIESGFSEFDMLSGKLDPDQQLALDTMMNIYETQEYNFWVSDDLSTADSVFFKILELKARYGVDLVVVDYMQNITVPSKEEYESLSLVSKELQRMSIIHDMAIIAVSQMNRESLRDGKKGFGFRGSSQIENSADIAITLEKRDEYPEELIVNVAKNRNGLTGAVRVKTDFAHGSLKDNGYAF